MGNTSVNFGYVNEYNMLKKLKINDYLRGCNPIEGEDISDYYDSEVIPPYLAYKLPSMKNLDLPRGLKSFTYRKLVHDSNVDMEKFAYIHLLVSSFCDQIFENLSRDGLVFCNFDALENNDIEDLTDAVCYFSEVLEFRGYATRVINGELLIINTYEDMEDKAINEITSTFHKSSITVQLKDYLVYKEEDVYRATSELLRLLPNYADIENIWNDCKSRLNLRHEFSFNELFYLAYDMLYVYAFLYPLDKTLHDHYKYREYSVTNMGRLVKRINPDARAKAQQFIEDIADTAFLLDGADKQQINLGKEVIMDSMLSIEELIDRCFTPELKIFKSLEVTDEDFEFLCYSLIKSHTELRAPIVIEEAVELEDSVEIQDDVEDEDLENVVVREQVGKSKVKKSGFKKYLPVLAIIVIMLAVIATLTLNR